MGIHRWADIVKKRFTSEQIQENNRHVQKEIERYKSIKSPHLRFKLMSEIQDAGDRLAKRLAEVLTIDELADLREVVDANRVNDDFYFALSDALESLGFKDPEK